MLFRAHERRFLEPFMGREKSTGEAAKELGVAVDAVAYRVRRFERLGLLERVREEARKGRAVKYYRAAPGFEIPLEVLPFADLEELFRELDAPLRELTLRNVARLAERAGLMAWQARCYRDDLARVRLELAPPEVAWEPRDLLRPEVPALLFNWVPLQLEAPQSKALQAELFTLLERYSTQGGAPTHLVGLFMAPLEEG